MSCACPTPCTFTEVPLEDISVQWDGPALGKKAQAFPARKAIFIDSAFWRSIPTVAGRAGLLAHERGHIEGAKCEPCADRRAGEILRREGWPTARDAMAAALSKLDNRSPEKAAEAMGEGFGADGNLLNRERAAGVDDELQAFLDDLAAAPVEFDGRTWRTMVGVDGGVRSDAKQFELFKKGRTLIAGKDPSLPSSWAITGEVVTYAASAKTGKHGRREAVDVWVLGPNDKPLLYPADARAAGVDFEGVYEALGRRGEARGLAWGGRWKKLVDRPHFETTGLVSKVVAAVTGQPDTDDPDSSSSSSSAELAGDDSFAIFAAAAVALVFLFLAV